MADPRPLSHQLRGGTLGNTETSEEPGSGRRNGSDTSGHMQHGDRHRDASQGRGVSPLPGHQELHVIPLTQRSDLHTGVGVSGKADARSGEGVSRPVPQPPH